MADDLLQDLWLHRSADVTVNTLTIHADHVTVHAATTGNEAGCPSCGAVLTRVHSSYVRRLDDSAAGGGWWSSYGCDGSAAVNELAPGPRSSSRQRG